MPENICDDIENDEFYQSFLKGKRDTKIIEKLTFSEQIQKLVEGVDLLSLELQSQVRDQHGALLSQASHAGRLNSALNTVSEHMFHLQSVADNMKTQVISQYNLVEQQTKGLNRLHDVAHILRLCGSTLQLTNKLRKTKDLNKQARIYFKLESLGDDPALKKIDFIIEERQFIVSGRQRLNNISQLDLLQGLKDGNETQVMNNLQIFVNLQTISKCVDNLIETFLNEIRHSLKECFAGTDPASLSSKILHQQETSKGISRTSSDIIRKPGKAPSLTTSYNFRTKLLKSLYWLISDEIYDYCQQINLLQKCLNNCYEATISLKNQENVHNKFWNLIENVLKTSFTECPPHIAQSLQEYLPKLWSAAKELEKKLYPTIIFSNTIFQSLETGYLSKCGANLKATLTSIDYSNTDTIDSFLKASNTELSSAMVDNRLLMLVVAVFNSCNKDFWNKIEANIKLGTDSKQVVDIPNVVQIQNSNLANLIFYHSNEVKRMIENFGGNFPKTAIVNILENLEIGKALTTNIVNQLIESINGAVGIIILSMHREPGLTNAKFPITGFSLYMKELQEFLQRCWNLHMNVFNDKEIVLESGRELASHCIELFVNNLAILRPLSNAGRERIRNDCKHLENIFNSIIGDISNLGKSFRLLRAISTLIIQTPENLVKLEIETESPVPCYIILFLLFSHGGNDLQNLHSAANLSNERLIQWLDEHNSERERLELVARVLQKYKDTIKRKNSTQYDSIYPLILDYFERAYAATI